MTKEMLRVLLLGSVLGLVTPSLATAVCGDGFVDPGESCDLGAGNGLTTTCCTTLCEYRGVGFTFGDPLVGCRGERVGQLDLLDVDAETLEDDRRRQGC